MMAVHTIPERLQGAGDPMFSEGSIDEEGPGGARSGGSGQAGTHA